jgi:hypothetical protein
MPEQSPQVNEYQRCLASPVPHPRSPCGEPLSPQHPFEPIPLFRLTPITEWGACVYARTGEIKAMSWSGLVTYATRYPVLDWEWLQRIKPDWVCCPKCGRSFPRDARYWWWRNKEKGYLWLDACRDCKCQTGRRVRDKKRVY